MGPNNVKNYLNWRYATKVFDKSKMIPDDIRDALLESMRLAPSSLGVQPWKFLIIDNVEIRKRIREVAHDQPQFTDAPLLIIFCRREDVNEKYIDEHVTEMSKIRGVTFDSLAQYKSMIMTFLSGLSPVAYETWTSKQVYIALGFLLCAAAVMGVDACPMEGFNALKVDEILGLKEKNLRSTVACALGYRDSSDTYAKLPKSRSPADKVIEWYK